MQVVHLGSSKRQNMALCSDVIQGAACRDKHGIVSMGFMSMQMWSFS